MKLAEACMAVKDVHLHDMDVMWLKLYRIFSCVQTLVDMSGGEQEK